MSQSDDLDMALDGYEPDSGYYRRPAPPVEAEDETQAPVPQTSARARRRRATETREPEVEEPVTDERERNEDEAPKGVSTLFKFFLDERVRLFVGCFLLLLSVFIVVALVSHFRNAKFDQSIVDNMTQAQIAANPSLVKNAAGGFGAWIAKALFCDALGIGSMAFIVYSWILALAVLGFKKCNFWSVTFKTLIVAISTSVVLGLVTYNTPSVIKWGGTHGYFVNEFLISHATLLGAICVSVLLLVAVACVYLDELTCAWKKWRLALERRRLQEELKREREAKAKHLADIAEAAKAEEDAKKAEESAEQAPVSIEVDETPAAREDPFAIDDLPAEGVGLAANSLEDVPDDFDIEIDAAAAPASKADDFTLSIDAAETDSQADAPMSTAFDIDEPASDGEAGESASLGAASVAASAAVPEPQPALDIQSALVPDASERGAKTEIVGDDFSVKAHEIEMADLAAMDALADAEAEAENKVSNLYDHKAELPRYVLPGADLLEERDTGAVIDMAEQQENKERIVKTLASYNIAISRIEATVGPTVTLYEIVPAEGVRISQIKRLEDDIALSLAALGIRIIAPIPGKPTVGIEVPNSDPQTVSMRSVIASKKFQECKMKLPMALGATISNEIFIADLAKMPHLLVAGATGMGKSVGLNVIITSLLYKRHPSELKFVMVDPKMVEFSLYSKLERHYLAKLPGEEEAIITDPKKAVQTLNSLCIEMDQRYALLKDAGVRALEEYNKKFTERRLNPADGHRFLPYLVVVVDEFADLIMVAGKEVEAPIMRIAQKARAVGMHMIIATQRPSTNVITGPIKANFPGRMAFRTIQMVDSKTILDASGANQLIGKGDMLFSHNGSLERVQCAFVDTPEVERITEWIGGQVGYEHAYYLPEYVPEGEEGGFAGPGTDKDNYFDDAARFVVSRQVGSTSMLQRQFNIGYNRAGRLMDQMEAAGIVGPVNGSKPRAILVDSMQLEQMLSQF